MGLWIKIRKANETNNIVYYQISTGAYGGGECYMGICKSGDKIYFYRNDDFSEPASIADSNKPDERIPHLPGISPSIIGHALMKAMKAARENEFPDIMDYAA